MRPTDARIPSTSHPWAANRPTGRATRTGFSLLELTVVITILGGLIGLILSAVQKVRESAARAKCQNKLRQLGLAVTTCEVTNGRFPPGMTTEKAKKPLSKKDHGWTVFVLPNMEQANLVAGYDWDKGWNDKDSPNVEIASQPVVTFSCPSSPAPQVVPTKGVINDMRVGDYRPVARGWATGNTNFVGPGGLMETATPPVVLKQPANQAIMRLHRKHTIADVKDGTSQSLLLTESAGSPNLYRQGRLVDTNLITGVPWASRFALMPLGGYAPAKANFPALSESVTGPGTVMVNGANQDEVYAFHPGDANVAFADGHVQFIRELVSAHTFIALVACQAGDVLDNF